MASFNHFDNAHFNFYPAPSSSASSTVSKFDNYPFWAGALVNDEATCQPASFTGNWGTGGGSDHVVDPPTDFQAVTSFGGNTHSLLLHQGLTDPGPTASVVGSDSEHWWPVIGQAQPHFPGPASWDNSFAGMTELEAPVVTPAPGSFPFDNWGDSQSGPSTSEFYVNSQPACRSGVATITTGPTPTLHFQPHEVPGSRQNEYRSAEAGPSALPPPFSPCYEAPPTTHPSGGPSETTADADTDQTNTEEDEIPRRPRRARGTGPQRIWRNTQENALTKLCVWAQWKKGLSERPIKETALRIVLKTVKKMRTPVYIEPRLKRGKGKETVSDKVGVLYERRQRKVFLEYNEELSKYYRLPGSRKSWTLPTLWAAVTKDLVDLQEPPANPISGSATTAGKLSGLAPTHLHAL